jgi:nucleotide-binding universal stress UspA family protein
VKPAAGVRSIRARMALTPGRHTGLSNGERMKRLQLRHILCPMDLSPLSLTALEWANAIARARRSELRALHVVVTDGLVAPEGLGSRERSDIMLKLREALVATDPENTHTGAAIRQGDPGTQILQFARSLPADVVVMGAAGAERPARPMSSLTATVVARCDCPILIVPAGREMRKASAGLFKQILCAVDLAPSSVGVIRQALSLAWETHAHVTFVCVMTEPTRSPSEIRTELMAAIPREAHSWCDIELVVEPGMPATEIGRIAETSNVEILLIGPPRHWTSTTQAVLAKSLCPVLITHDARPLPYPSGKIVTATGAPR